MRGPIITNIKRRRMEQLISEGKRADGRDLMEYRPITIEKGFIERAEGSARVRLGRTEVAVGVKIEVESPFPDTPEEGILMVNAELVPLASPTFEPGPPDENAIELARVVDRGIRESKAIDLKKLCIVPGEKVFTVFVDIYVLNHDGNLIDASAMGALAALTNTKMFGYTVKGGEVTIKREERVPLPIQNHPVTVTFAKLGDELVVDPSLEEEEVMDARLTITVDDKGRICAAQKGGSGFLTLEEIAEAVKMAQVKAREIRELVVG